MKENTRKGGESGERRGKKSISSSGEFHERAIAADGEKWRGTMRQGKFQEGGGREKPGIEMRTRNMPESRQERRKWPLPSSTWLLLENSWCTRTQLPARDTGTEDFFMNFFPTPPPVHRQRNFYRDPKTSSLSHPNYLSLSTLRSGWRSYFKSTPRNYVFKTAQPR